MSEEKNTTQTPAVEPAVQNQVPGPATAPRAGGRPGRGASRGGRGGEGAGRGRGRGDRRSDSREPKEYEQKILELSRVTRVTAGGKRMRFRAALVIGNQAGKVGFGVAKGADVAMAVEKAFRQAKKNMFVIPMANETVPHAVNEKFGAAIVLLKPAPKGTGLKAGGAVRVVLELGGVPNAVSKIQGSSNKINVAKATMKALKRLRLPVKVASEVK
ncbi:MAG: ribosomal protein S5, nonfunctional [Candidatus Uhrbacteria bacterium GW2011_GWE2_45_35]|uniref:Small ribosomal subunit protein uS5 n=2 Tax=Candidatus Uhriibacteriota TaxID=1752732 RepID=A0A0G1JKV4_9BACT|nr:MAG: ribosomal protein S5, nonfunctional [Candidatus Uhrbacteria bacterium GW2011_GWF2_44_350]KKU09244.1 MAG: ribosomal protein S5, nonfunctional [Candidatus Uhrbacteria bacterium GW2011_GWE2_45_35]HBR80473.1 30S ribosomal protein S5 [Candidatus Uhrbacteria bacterium]HCU31542.1 30S ribosomal protein S5 [Candidatus Uhrbacteria bacterium]